MVWHATSRASRAHQTPVKTQILDYDELDECIIKPYHEEKVDDPFEEVIGKDILSIYGYSMPHVEVIRPPSPVSIVRTQSFFQSETSYQALDKIYQKYIQIEKEK